MGYRRYTASGVNAMQVFIEDGKLCCIQSCAYLKICFFSDRNLLTLNVFCSYHNICDTKVVRIGATC